VSRVIFNKKHNDVCHTLKKAIFYVSEANNLMNHVSFFNEINKSRLYPHGWPKCRMSFYKKNLTLCPLLDKSLKCRESLDK
jgi:hypothetical protein